MAHETTQPSSATKNHAQYKILGIADVRNAAWSAPTTFEFDLLGETSMKVNDKAPDFTLQDENGKELASRDLRGKTVVLYFYPRADTPG